MCATIVHAERVRSVASSWEKECGNTLKDAGFVIGRANTRAFWHPEKGVSVVVHGDDFVRVGLQDDLKCVECVVRKKYPMKMRAMLGPDPH